MPIDLQGDAAVTELPSRAVIVERDGIEAVVSAAETVVLPVIEERIGISKRRIATGSVRVATHTSVEDTIAEVDLDRYRVEIERVPVGRVVDAVPPARVEGDITVVSVVEERLVLVKQLVLTEELHIRHVVARETVQETVPLRRQHVTIERRDAAGHLSRDPE